MHPRMTSDEFDAFIDDRPDELARLRAENERLRALISVAGFAPDTQPQAIRDKQMADEQKRFAIEGELDEAREWLSMSFDALWFYADPETYVAISFLPDPPCGDFADDFDESYSHQQLSGPRPGKFAREFLEPIQSAFYDYLMGNNIQPMTEDAQDEAWRDFMQEFSRWVTSKPVDCTRGE